MTRQQIEDEYTVEAGRIRSPGKFEGEMVYLPHFYDAYLDGLAEDDDGEVLSFDITPEDREQFPELGCRRVLRLYIRDDGFVCEC